MKLKFLNVIIGLNLVTISLLANAGDLTIANNTKNDLSFLINNICSNKFDGFGVIPANTTKTIFEKNFKEECNYNPQNCIAIVFDKAKCKGNYIAEIGFNTNMGISYVGGNTSSSTSITYSKYNLIFSSPIKK